MSYSDRKEGNWDYQRINGYLKAQEKANKAAIKAAKKTASYQSAPKTHTVDEVMADYNNWLSGQTQPKTADQVMADFNAWNADEAGWMAAQTPVQPTQKKQKKEEKREEKEQKMYAQPERPAPSAITKGGIPELEITDPSMAYSQVVDYKEKKRKAEEDKASQDERHAKNKAARLEKQLERTEKAKARKDWTYKAPAQSNFPVYNAPEERQGAYSDLSDRELTAAIASLDPLRTSRMGFNETMQRKALGDELANRQTQRYMESVTQNRGEDSLDYLQRMQTQVNPEDAAAMLAQTRRNAQIPDAPAAEELIAKDDFTKADRDAALEILNKYDPNVVRKDKTLNALRERVMSDNAALAFTSGVDAQLMNRYYAADKAVANLTGGNNLAERTAMLDPQSGYTQNRIMAANAANAGNAQRAELLNRAADEAAGKYDFKNAAQSAARDHELAYGAGRIAGAIGENVMLNGLLSDAGWTVNTGNKVIDFLGNQGIKLIPDVLGDTVPEIMEAYDEGQRGLDLAATAAKNVAVNELFNLGVDYVAPFVGKKLFGNKAAKEAAIPSQNVLNPIANADNVVKAADNSALSPLELARKNAEGVDEIVQSSAQAQKNLENLAEQAQKQVTGEDVTNAVQNAIDAEKAVEPTINSLRKPQTPNPVIDRIEDATRNLEESIPKAQEQLTGYRNMVEYNIGKYDVSGNEALESLVKDIESNFDAYEKAIMSGNSEAADEVSKTLRNNIRRFDTQAKKSIQGYGGELGTRTMAMSVDHPANSIRVARNLKVDADSVMNEWNTGIMSEFGAMTKEQYDAFLKEAQDLGWVDELGNPTKEALSALEKQAPEMDPLVKNALEQGETNSRAAGNILRQLEEEEKAGLVSMTEDDWYKMVDAADNYAKTGEKQYLDQMNDIVFSKHAVADNAMPAAKNVPEQATSIGESIKPDDGTRISSARTNTYERLGYGENMPMEDYRYKVYGEEAQKADAIERYKGNQNIAQTILNKDLKDIDEVDVKAAFSEMQQLMDKGDPNSLRLANALGQKTAAAQREGGRVIQASAEYTKNTAAGALQDAANVQEGLINTWKGRNVKAYEGNKRLANALASMGNTENAVKKATEQSFDEIKRGVRKELDKELGSISKQFSDADIDYIANLIENGITKDELANALNMKLATGSFGISDETLKKVNDIFNEIKQYNPDSKMFVEGQAEAYRLLADELLPSATVMEKFEAWRYLAMLGNPKTMLRNKIGNDTFNVVTGISNNIAAMAEAGIDKAVKAAGGEGIQRTKSVLNPIADGDLIKAASNDADVSSYRQLMGTKYEKMNSSTLRQHKSVFDSKLAQLYENAVDKGISDYKAAKRKYTTSLAGYLKANGYGDEIFAAEDQLKKLKDIGETRLLSEAEQTQIESLTKDVSNLKKAREYALKQAEYATFHEDNKIADVLTKWSRTSKEEGTGLGHIMIEGMVPFKKTPANVLRSGFEISPLGVIDSIRKTGKFIYENSGKRAGNLAATYLKKNGKEVTKTLASDVIDSWAKTLTGTGLTALGFYLYNKGVLHSSDNDTQYQDQLEGHQNYALEINGHSYTIDWAAPSIMPLMVGAELAKLWDSTGKGDEDFFDNVDNYFAAANSIVNPLIETSMLQGVQNSIESAADAARNNDYLGIPLSLMYNLGTGYLSQGIPTVFGQVARTVDPVRRSTYTDKTGIPGVLDKQLKKQMNKIPFLSMLNEEYVDTYGRTQNNSPTDNPLLNLGYQMLSPGYHQNINETDADRVSREAYNVNQETGTLPKWQNKYEVNGERANPETYTRYAKVYGEAQSTIRNALANNEWFNEQDDMTKAAIISDVNSLANGIAKAEMGEEVSDKAVSIYREAGVDLMLEYLKTNMASKYTTESGNKTSSTYSKVNALADLSDDALDKLLPEFINLTNDEGVPNNAGRIYDQYGARTLIDYYQNGYKVTGTNKLPKTKAEAAEAALMFPKNMQKDMLNYYLNQQTYTMHAKTSKAEQEVLDKQGVAGLQKYVEQEDALKKYGSYSYSSDERAQKIFQQGGIPALEQYGQTRQALQKAGVKSGDAYDVYIHAKSVDPSITMQKFSAQYKYIDSLGDSKGEGKNNGKLSQEEICAAMTARPNDAKAIEELYWTSTKKKPVMKNGVYKPTKVK